MKHMYYALINCENYFLNGKQSVNNSITCGTRDKMLRASKRSREIANNAYGVDKVTF